MNIKIVLVSSLFLLAAPAHALELLNQTLLVKYATQLGGNTNDKDLQNAIQIWQAAHDREEKIPEKLQAIIDTASPEALLQSFAQALLDAKNFSKESSNNRLHLYSKYLGRITQKRADCAYKARRVLGKLDPKLYGFETKRELFTALLPGLIEDPTAYGFENKREFYRATGCERNALAEILTTITLGLL